VRSGGSMMQEDGRDSEVLKRKETEARDAMSICGGAPARRAARPRPKGRTVLIEIPTDRVDGISNTVHPWARIVRPMRLVRLRFGASQRPSSSLGAEQPDPLPAVVLVAAGNLALYDRHAMNGDRTFLPAARGLPGETSTYVLYHWLGVPSVPVPSTRSICSSTRPSMQPGVHARRRRAHRPDMGDKAAGRVPPARHTYESIIYRRTIKKESHHSYYYSLARFVSGRSLRRS